MMFGTSSPILHLFTEFKSPFSIVSEEIEAIYGHCKTLRRFVDSSILLELEPDQHQEVDGDHGDVVGDEDGEVGPGPGEVQ